MAARHRLLRRKRSAADKARLPSARPDWLPLLNLEQPIADRPRGEWPIRNEAIDVPEAAEMTLGSPSLYSSSAVSRASTLSVMRLGTEKTPSSATVRHDTAMLVRAAALDFITTPAAPASN